MSAVLLPLNHHTDTFASYPMVQVLMHRWGYHRPGTWHLMLHCGGFGDFVNREAVMDDFGNLVVVPQ